MILIRNETTRRLNKEKKIDINKIINKHNLNNNLNNSHNSIFFIKKIKNIILLSILILIIVGLVIFLILNNSQKNKKIPFSLHQNNINITNQEGYYIPKDNLVNSFYKKCSVENCKKCYGTSYKDTCISCLSSYKPLLDENNKIISCEFNPQKEDDENITLKESNEIYLTDNDMEIKSQLITDISEIKTELITNKITSNINEITTQITQTTQITTQQTSIQETTTIKCDSGYYYPKGDNINQKCKKCSSIGCEICHGNITVDYCDSCYSNYFPKYINNYLSCIEPDKNCIKYDKNTFECLNCDFEYVLYEGNCYAYSFVATYFTEEDNYNIKLINLNKNYIDKIISENKIIKNSKYNTYEMIPYKGYHQVYYIFKNNPTSFTGLFQGCKNLISINFTSHINSENIINMYSLFTDCIYLISVDFSEFNAINVKDMSLMFSNCYNLTFISQKFNTRKVESMYSIFLNCYSLTSLNIGNFAIKNVQNFDNMFYNCISLTFLILPYSVNGGDIKLKYTNYMFYKCEKLTSINLNNLDLSFVEEMTSMFSGCSSLEIFHFPYFNKVLEDEINTKRNSTDYNVIQKVISTTYMFKDCISLKRVNISNWNLNNVIRMSSMFQNCISLEEIIFPDFNASELKYIDSLFNNCKSLTKVNITKFKNTYNLISMSYMFENCISLKEIDLSSFDISSISYIQNMFSGCTSLTYVNFNNTSSNNIKYMNSLFEGCYSLTSVNFNNFYTEKVNDMSRMFYNCSSISYLNLNSFNTTNVRYMDEMFYGCSNLIDLYILNFESNSLISYNYMFKNSNTSMIRYAKYDFYDVLNSDL